MIKSPFWFCIFLRNFWNQFSGRKICTWPGLPNMNIKIEFWYKNELIFRELFSVKSSYKLCILYGITQIAHGNFVSCTVSVVPKTVTLLNLQQKGAMSYITVTHCFMSTSKFFSLVSVFLSITCVGRECIEIKRFVLAITRSILETFVSWS